MGNTQSLSVIGEGEYDFVLDIDTVTGKRTDRGVKQPPVWQLYCSKAQLFRMIENDNVQMFNGDQEDEEGQPPKLSDTLFHLPSSSFTFVAVIGLFNRGKTFLVNKLGKKKLDSSRRVSTRGISFLLPSDFGAQSSASRLVFLDTAGTSSPLQYFGDDTAPMMEKKALEMLLNDVVFRLSDVLVCVVAEVTWGDQQQLYSLFRSLQASEKPNKDLIVVHNLMSVNTSAELQVAWDKIITCYQGTVQWSDEKIPFFVTNQSTTKAGCMKHVFLVQEGTSLGNRYNPRSIRMINQWIASYSSQKKDTLRGMLQSTIQSSLETLCSNVAKVEFKETRRVEMADPPSQALYDQDVEIQWERTAEEIQKVLRNEELHRFNLSGITLEVQALDSQKPLTLKSNSLSFDGGYFSLCYSNFIPDYSIYDVAEHDSEHGRVPKQKVIVMDFPSQQGEAVKAVFGHEGLVITGERRLTAPCVALKDGRPTKVPLALLSNFKDATPQPQERRAEGKFRIDVPLQSSYEFQPNPFVLSQDGIVAVACLYHPQSDGPNPTL